MSDGETIPISEWPPPDEQKMGDKSPERKRSREVEEEGIITCKKKISECDPCSYEWESVDRLVARWYRHHATILRSKYPGLLPQAGKASPRTILDLVVSTQEGRKLLTDKRQEMESLDQRMKNSFHYHYHVACIKDRLKEKEAALSSNWTALTIAGVDSYQLKHIQVSQYLKVIHSLSEIVRSSLWLQYKLQYEFTLSETRPTAIDQKLSVERMAYSAIDGDTFREEFCKPRRPLLLHNVPPPMKEEWSVEYIRDVAGDSTVEIRTPLPGSSEWAGLETGASMKVRDLLSDGFPTSGQYIFDWSLPLHCPVLASQFIVASIFTDNYLTMTNDSALYHNSWPSLFIARRGTNSGLHIDAFASHFWMYLVSGKKRWTFYPGDQVANLAPVFSDSTDPVFRPTDDQLSRVPFYSVDLCPGELLFVPSGCPHRVENVEDSVAVSGNFVNESNVKETVKHLRINALQDPRAADLLREWVHMKLIQ